MIETVSSANLAHVLAGKSTDIIWQFTPLGEFVFACLIPGHLPAGMQGEIRKEDIAQGKFTIKHGYIKNLGMPSMTMMFRVRDPAMLKTVKTGDAVQFVVELEKGVMVITELKKNP